MNGSNWHQTPTEPRFSFVEKSTGSQVCASSRKFLFSFRATISTLYFHLCSIFLDAVASLAQWPGPFHTFIWPLTFLLVRHSIFFLLVLRVTFLRAFLAWHSPHLSDFPPPITPSSFTRHSLFPALHVLCPRLYTHKENNQSKVEGEKGVEGGDRARPKDVCDFIRHPCFKWI